jgi:hypothetical protein
MWLVCAARVNYPWTILVLRKQRIHPDGNVYQDEPAAVYKRYQPFYGYKGGDVLKWNEYGLFTYDAPKDGFGSVVQLNPDTLEEIPGTRDKWPPVAHSGYSVAGSSGSVPKPVMYGDKAAPYVAFLFSPGGVAASDQSRICSEVELQYRTKYGVGLLIGNRRPPSAWKLDPGRYGVVNVLGKDEWPWANTGNTFVRWNKARTDGTDPAVWVNSAGLSWDRVLLTVCHEMGHAIADLADLYLNAPPGSWPGYLMGATWYADYRENFRMDPPDVTKLRGGHANMIGRGGSNR